MTVGSAELSNQVLYRVMSQYAGREFSLAGADALSILDQGHRHPIPALILAHCGILAGEDAWLARGIEEIERILREEPQAAALMAMFDKDYIAGHAKGAFHRGEAEAVLKLLEIARRLNPELARAFPEAPRITAARPAPPRPAPVVARAKPETGGMVDPLADRPARRGVVMIAKYFFGPESREHEIGPRFAHGLTRAGWPTRLAFPAYEGKVRVLPDLQRVVSALLHDEPDFVIIDNFVKDLPRELFLQTIGAIRHLRPAVRIIHANLDPWAQDHWDHMRELACLCDLVWSHFPSAGVFQAPEFRGKLFTAPFPMGIDPAEVAPPRRRPDTPFEGAAFQGAIEWYNVSRAYWLAALDAARVPVERWITAHDDDGLPAIDSYRAYLQRLASIDAILNLCLRLDGSRIITGRSFETIFAGACLIQERTPDMDHYFIADEHYLSFESFDDLRAILERLRREPALARETAARGRAFFLAHYDDATIRARLDRALWP